MGHLLNERGKSILGAIIQEYISTGEPVGSRVIARKYNLNLSPATIRNVMADLEDMGYLYQPHVSAGRIPTPEGLRVYLDKILELKSIPIMEKSSIDRHMSSNVADFMDLLHEASHMLTEFSHQASIVILPKPSAFSLRRIEFVRLDKARILVILVSNTGMVYNHIVYGEDIPQSELMKYNNYLNETYVGLTVQRMRDLLLKEMSGEKARFDRIISKATDLGMKVLDVMEKEESPDILIEGKESLFDHPEMEDLEKLKVIVKAFEDKGRIVRILNKVIGGRGVKVFLGDDLSNIGVRDFSVVATSYHKGNLPAGSLGVIGPMRMDYSRVIPIVDYVAKVLSYLLEDF